jgi:3-oxoacyl-(acyl-carrier-protein) synthase
MYFKHNESPEQGSRPMSASASGFVPGSGAMVLEDYETALARGATIYAEVLGGNVNQADNVVWNNDSPKSGCSKKCIQNAENAGVGATEIDTINGI